MADNNTPQEYKDCLEGAQIAEAADRYEDMAKYLVDAIDKNANKLEKEGRNQFSVAFKNIIGSRRQQWRSINQKKMDEETNPSKDTDKKKQMIKELKDKIEGELEEWCGKVLGHIKTLLENCPTPEEIKAMKENDPLKKEAQEDKINYLKMIGDYNRYRAEYLEGDDRENVKTAASEAYGKAVELAKEALEETDPTRLGLMLNFSVFNYEVMKETEKACNLAKDAFDQAIAKLDSLSDNSYKDSTLIMQLLRDNLTLWTSENDDNNNAGD